MISFIGPVQRCDYGISYMHHAVVKYICVSRLCQVAGPHRTNIPDESLVALLNASEDTVVTR